MTIQISNPSFDYNSFGHRYAGIRKTDPVIDSYIIEALGKARSVLNVGAGTGSYEPSDRYVVAVEPSSVMRAQRAAHRVPALAASADSLPFDDQVFDASMAIVTVHHWPDIARGLNEMRRVTRHQVLVLTFDPEALDDFWMAEYAPELIAVEKARYPSIGRITEILEGKCEVQHIPVPLHCFDGFQEAFYGRPEAFLEKEVRLNQSAWGFLSYNEEQDIMKRLSADMESGEWDKKYSHLREQPSYIGSLRLIIANP
jgi:SAM-dependent methyltransferase